MTTLCQGSAKINRTGQNTLVKSNCDNTGTAGRRPVAGRYQAGPLQNGIGTTVVTPSKSTIAAADSQERHAHRRADEPSHAVAGAHHADGRGPGRAGQIFEEKRGRGPSPKWRSQIHGYLRLTFASDGVLQ